MSSNITMTNQMMSKPMYTPDIAFVEAMNPMYHASATIMSMDHWSVNYFSLSNVPHNMPQMFNYSLLALKDQHKNHTNDKFQFGKITIMAYETSERCNDVTFKMPFAEMPVVKLQTHCSTTGRMTQNTAPDYSAYTNVWIRKCDKKGFTMCYREGIAFSGRHNLTIGYMAVSGATHQFSEVGMSRFHDGNKLPSMMPTGMVADMKFCQKQFFSAKYQMPPMVFVTPAEGMGGAHGGELMAYVAAVEKDHMWVCARSTTDRFDAATRQSNVTVGYIVSGKADPCSTHKCADHLQCYSTEMRNGQEMSVTPYCACKMSCPMEKPFCGDDMITYKSMCHLQMMHCKKHGQNSTSNVTMVHEGKCRAMPYDSGTTKLDKIAGVNVAFCKKIPLNELMFHANLPMHVQLTVNWNTMQKFKSNPVHEASASWTEDVTVKGFRACVMVAGRHFFEQYPEPSVNWVAYQTPYHANMGDQVLGGMVDMPTWYTGSRCVTVKPMRMDDNMPLNISDYRMLVSVEHTIKGYTNAMNAWSEAHMNMTNNGMPAIQVCARELQNFDGLHKGVRLHWLMVAKPQSPYISEAKHMIFPFQNKFGAAVPVSCADVEVNMGYPSLPKAMTFISPNPYLSNNEMKKVNTHFSPRDYSVWIESQNQTNMHVCIKSLRTTQHREPVSINIVTLPYLCDGGWDFFDGSCYKRSVIAKTNAAAKLECSDKLVTVQSAAEQHYLERTSVPGKSSWIGYTDAVKEGTWVWADGKQSSYTKWMTGRPDGDTSENCAIIMPGSMGWNDVACSVTQANAICEKPAEIMEKACSAMPMKCQNGGECVMKNMGLGCKCKSGFAGKFCEKDVSQLPSCKGPKMMDSSFRSVNNTVNKIGNCDSRDLTNSTWYRFNGGQKIVQTTCVNGLNRCGGKFPGYITAEHPTSQEITKTVDLFFYSSYCQSDRAKVEISNCGDYYTYRFHFMPWYSCDFTVCTSM